MQIEEEKKKNQTSTSIPELLHWADFALAAGSVVMLVIFFRVVHYFCPDNMLFNHVSTQRTEMKEKKERKKEREEKMERLISSWKGRMNDTKCQHRS